MKAEAIAAAVAVAAVAVAAVAAAVKKISNHDRKMKKLQISLFCLSS
jgi:hypothetical protein